MSKSLKKQSSPPTQDLRKRLAAQSLELNVQAALERVRQVALRMKQPEDMLKICAVISRQLEKLGVENIRNIQTAIFYPARHSYMNYEYYCRHDKTVATETAYNNHPIAAAFARKMLKGKGEFFHSSIRGEKVKDWLAYQKTTNVFIDKWLRSASSLNYYWHSLGPVALGLSAYEPLSREASRLFKRFVQVFELAYQRYLDIEEARRKAHAIEIEMLAEKLRSRAMAMRHSNDLPQVVLAMRQAIDSLHIRGVSAITLYLRSHEGRIRLIDCTRIKENQGSMDVQANIEFNLRHSTSWYRKLFRLSKNYAVMDRTLNDWKESIRWFGRFNRAYARDTARFVKNHVKTQTWHATVKLQNGRMGVDLVEPPPDDMENLLLNMGAAFDLAYTRFNDLQQAEAQAKEAQIEAALERVRSRTMAMHKSDELKEVIRVVLDQFETLNINVGHAGFYIDYKAHDDMHIWLADPNIEPFYAVLPYFNSPTWNSFLDAKKTGKRFYTDLLDFRTKNKFYKSLFKLFSIPEEARQFYLACRGLAVSTVLLDSVGLYIENFSAIPYTDEENKILMRFGNVFQQTYTRFLDLQKAETQAREAQIEASLERVRAASMAMHRSQELQEVIKVVCEQLLLLGIQLDSTLFVKVLEDGSWNIWNTTPTQTYPARINIPFISIPPMTSVNKASAQGKKELSLVLSKKEKDAFLSHFFARTDAHSIPVARKKYVLNSPGHALSFFFMKDIILGITTLSGIPFSEEVNEIFRRFQKVFEQAYTRYLDLQKAEAQAKEAQIEAALEKIRSRSLAMHRSDELQDLVNSVFGQLKALHIDMNSASIYIFKEGTKDWQQWVAAPETSYASYFHIPYSNQQVVSDLEKARQSGKDFFSAYYSRVEKNKWFDYAFKHTDYRKIPAKRKKYIKEAGCMIVSYALSKHTAVQITKYLGEPFSVEENEIVKRIANVFEQAYVRFLDLQKAEAQAREAEIQLALERVRARTMAMHKSEELSETVAILFQQLNELGNAPERTNICLMNEETGFMEVWSTEQGGQKIDKSFLARLDEPTTVSKIYKGWKANRKSLVIDLSGKALEEWIRFLKEEMKVPFNEAFRQKQRVHSIAFFSQGALLVTTQEPVPLETINLLERFAYVFNLTYRRFLDLEYAEAQAREAQIEAALEKVRSRTLAMQKSDELPETSAIIFQQLIGLGISPNRLYISILKNEEGDAEFWITDEDGRKVSKAYEDNLHKNASFKKMYEGWKQQQKSLVIDMKDGELKEYLDYLNSIHVPFKGGLEQKRRVQHLAYFSKGFIGMASPDEQPAETLQLLERFAYVFNLTFTRFNDLKMAEAHAQQAEQDLIAIKTARKKAENALAELQSTQKQLIQSEKMASLGELTAGIAHEIQNPLNFVNNFSDVSSELLGEMKDELAKGNIEEALAIAEDVRQNLEKINQHGKRADGIVKGMLQHSRKSSGQKELTDINVLADEYLRLAYHGLRAKDKSFTADFETDFDPSLEKVSVIPQDIGRVMLNLINNAFYAVEERRKREGDGFKPLVIVGTKKRGNTIEISVSDNGGGIPDSIREKIFQPFFTTKPTGSGTGLGLSLSYDIVKAHGGEIKLASKEGDGTVFILQLPFNS